MPVVIICSGCNKKLRAPDAMIGKQIRCPSCNAISAVNPPAPPPELPSSASTAFENPFDFSEGGSESRPIVVSEYQFCELCKRQAPTAQLSFKWVVGAIAWVIWGSFSGRMCRDCAAKNFWTASILTFFLGWWSIVGFIFAPICLIINITQYAAAGRLRRRDAEGELVESGSGTNVALVIVLVVLGVFLAGGGGLVFCCCGLPLLTAPGGNAQAGRGPRVEPPPVPEPDEGPAPQGWTVLFRSNDPSVWNTDSPGERFAMPVRKAHRTVRYLRLTRMDTKEFLIVPVTHAKLSGDGRPNPARGHWWHGTNHDKWGGRHLGIVQIPPEPAANFEAICITTDDWVAFVGSGFGHRYGKNDRQYHAWQGKEIPATTFEVAVTCDALSEDEARFLK